MLGLPVVEQLADSILKKEDLPPGGWEVVGQLVLENDFQKATNTLSWTLWWVFFVFFLPGLLAF